MRNRSLLAGSTAIGGCAAGSRFFHTPGHLKQFLIIYRGGLAAAVTPLSLLNGKNRARAWWSGLKVSIHLKRPPRLEEQSFAWRAHPCPLPNRASTTGMTLSDSKLSTDRITALVKFQKCTKPALTT